MEARKIFNLWPLKPEESNTVEACLLSLVKYMVPQKDVKLARYEFFQCYQQPASEECNVESVIHFINRARELVKDCNFGNLEDEMLRDKIITGILDTNLKKRFIEQQNLTSAMVIAQCQTEEATRAEMERHNWLQPGPSSHSVNKLQSSFADSGKKTKQKCTFCGKGFHNKLSDCPARGVTCNYCMKKTTTRHFAGRNRKINTGSNKGSQDSQAGIQTACEQSTVRIKNRMKK